MSLMRIIVKIFNYSPYYSATFRNCFRGADKILATWTPDARRGLWARPVHTCTRVENVLTVRQPEHYRNRGTFHSPNIETRVCAVHFLRGLPRRGSRRDLSKKIQLNNSTPASRFSAVVVRQSQMGSHPRPVVRNVQAVIGTWYRASSSRKNNLRLCERYKEQL
jgi:hypothetical protein